MCQALSIGGGEGLIDKSVMHKSLQARHNVVKLTKFDVFDVDMCRNVLRRICKSQICVNAPSSREVIPRGRIRLVPNLDMSLKCERRDMSHDVDWAAIGR